MTCHQAIDYARKYLLVDKIRKLRQDMQNLSNYIQSEYNTISSQHCEENNHKVSCITEIYSKYFCLYGAIICCESYMQILFNRLEKHPDNSIRNQIDTFDQFLDDICR